MPVVRVVGAAKIQGPSAVTDAPKSSLSGPHYLIAKSVFVLCPTQPTPLVGRRRTGYNRRRDSQYLGGSTTEDENEDSALPGR